MRILIGPSHVSRPVNHILSSSIQDRPIFEPSLLDKPNLRFVLRKESDHLLDLDPSWTPISISQPIVEETDTNSDDDIGTDWRTISVNDDLLERGERSKSGKKRKKKKGVRKSNDVTTLKTDVNAEQCVNDTNTESIAKADANGSIVKETEKGTVTISSNNTPIRKITTKRVPKEHCTKLTIQTFLGILLGVLILGCVCALFVKHCLMFCYRKRGKKSKKSKYRLLDPEAGGLSTKRIKRLRGGKSFRKKRRGDKVVHTATQNGTPTRDMARLPEPADATGCCRSCCKPKKKRRRKR